MRILITGVTGFVGGHLAEALLAEGGHAVAGRRPAGRLAGRPGATWPGRPSCTPATCSTRPAVEARGPRGPAGVGVPPGRVRQHRPVVPRAGPLLGRQPRRPPASCTTPSRRSGLPAADPVRVHRAGVRRPGRPRPGRATSGPRCKPASPYAASKAAADLLELPVHPHARARRRPRPAVQPDRPAAVGRLRRRPTSPARSRAIEAGRAAAGDRDRRPVGRAGHDRRAGHGGRVPAADGARARRARRTTPAAGETYRDAGRARPAGRGWRRVPVEVRQKAEPGRAGGHGRRPGRRGQAPAR